MSIESHELFLFAYSDANLYRQRILPIIANLKKKIAKGTYDPTLALKLWKYAADDAAQRYTKEFGGAGNKGYGSFSPADRRETAKELQEHYEEHLRENPRRSTRNPIGFASLAAHAIGVTKKNPGKRKAAKRKPRLITRQTIDCIELRGVRSGVVYFRAPCKHTNLGDLKAYAAVIAKRNKEAVSATKIKVKV